MGEQDIIRLSEELANDTHRCDQTDRLAFVTAGIFCAVFALEALLILVATA